MKRSFFASVLALSTLWFAAPAQAAALPPLPAARASFNAGTVRVDVYGTPGKPALLFIPGLTCGPWEWAGEIRRFSNGYTIYALTLPGFDGQPAVSGDLFARVSSDIWNLLETQRIDKPIVIGHSLGGTLGFLLAEQHSERLRALVAVEGMPVFPGMETLTASARAAIAQRMASMSSATAGLPYLITSPADVASATPPAARSNVAATSAWAQQDMLLDLRARLHAIDIPVLEVAPFDPQFDPLGQARIATAQDKQAYYVSLLAGVASLSVQVIQPSRHFVMYDAPEPLHKTIDEFVTGIERSENRERPGGS